MSGPVTLGADPELIFVGPGGIVSAGQHLPAQNRHGQNAELGADGHPWTAEVRPMPAKTPKGLVKNIRDILERNKDALSENIAWQAGSFVEDKSIGGHIHFGNSDAIPDQQEFVDLLDGLLLQFTVLLEDELGARRRRSSNYGMLGDIRSKGSGHFEYRPLASWLVSEQIALGVIALAKALLIETIEEGPHSIRRIKGPDLRSLTHINTMSLIRCDKQYFYERFETVFKIVRRLVYWQTEEGKLLWKNVAMLRHIINKYPDWHNNKDVLERWGIRKTPPTYKFERAEIQPVVQVDEVIAQDQAGAVWQRINRYIGDE